MTGRSAHPLPPELAELEARARHARTPCNKGTIAWRSWGAGERVMVLLHGGAGWWAHFARNIPVLERHATLWVPDLPGMGESDLPPEPWTPQSLADLLEQGLQAIVGERQVDLVGFSFGGMVAGHWAARHPARVRRAVIADAAGTGLANPPLGAMKSWRGIADPAERRELHRHNLRVWMLHDPAKADALATSIAAIGVESDRLRNREVSASDSLLKALPQVRCPVHGLWAEHDVLFVERRTELKQTLLEAGLASVTSVPDAGHWIQYEQAQAFDRHVLELLG